MQLQLMLVMLLCFGAGLLLICQSLEFRFLSHRAPLPVTPPIRRIQGCLMGFALFCCAWVAFTACASAKPILQDARDEFVKACNALTAAYLSDAQPSKVERIADKVCLAEKMGETIEREIVSDADGLGLFTPTAPDAGAR